jgi:aconitate hydratase
MGMNVTHKVIGSHCGLKEIEKGMEIPLEIDQVLLTDTLGLISFLYLEAMSVSRIKTKLGVCYVDHNTLQTVPEGAEEHRFLQSLSAKMGLHFSKPGNGICHQLHYERFGTPGETLIGTDSHTPTAGGVGMLAMGAGSLDVAAALAGSPFYFSVPGVMLVRLKGKLSPWVSAKDVALEVLRRLDVRGGRGKILEYGGPGLRHLSVPERATIANMGAETGATCSIFPSDSITRSYLQMQDRGNCWKELKADPDSDYDEELEIDLKGLEPLVAKPHSPGNVGAVREVAGLKVHQILIGSCTNSSLRDLMAVAHILKGKRVHPEISVTISPGSRLVLQLLAKKGHLADLLEAGVRILEPVCGPCVALAQAPPRQGVSLRTFNRNFKGRSGTPDAQVFLVSPETAAASALSGKLTDPRSLGVPPLFRMPRRVKTDDLILPPAQRPEDVSVIRGGHIQPIHLPGKFASEFQSKVLLKLGDDINTDQIIPAGQRGIALRSNIPALSDLTFESVDPTFAARAKKEGGGVIVSRENYGQGSSREHAVLCPRYLGVKAVLARSFARIHMNNLINLGILPLTIGEEEYNRLEAGDDLRFSKVEEALMGQGPLLVENLSKGGIISVVLNGTDRQKSILLAGDLMKFIRASLNP